MTPKVQRFLQQAAGLAGQLGDVPVLIVVRDPGTRVVSFVGTPGALANMQAEIAAKVGGEEQADTGWDG